jgi:FtsZ-interacting cell division protein ZipA
MKYLKYSGQIIIGIAVIVAILVFFGPCGNKKVSQENKVLTAENKQLKEKVRADSVTRATERIAEKSQIAAARHETAEAIADKKAADKKLTDLQRRANQLAALITSSPEIPESSIDTACRELAAQVPALNQQVDQYRKEADEAMELLNYEVVLRDSIIEKETEYSTKLKADFNQQSRLLETALKSGKPRGKLLAGAGVIGNQTTFLSGAKIALAYQTKGGKQYQAGGILLNKTIYYEATVMVPLFK